MPIGMRIFTTDTLDWFRPGVSGTDAAFPRGAGAGAVCPRAGVQRRRTTVPEANAHQVLPKLAGGLGRVAAPGSTDRPPTGRRLFAADRLIRTGNWSVRWPTGGQ